MFITRALDVATAHTAQATCSFEIYISFHFNSSNEYKLQPLLLKSMSIIEEPPLSVGTPAIPAHGMNTQGNTTHHMDAAAFGVEGITLARLRPYVTKAIQDVIKPAIKAYLETCDTNPLIAAVAAIPALLGFLFVFAFFTIWTLVLVVWSIFTITSTIISVIVACIISLVFKLLVLVLVTLWVAAFATGLLVGSNMVSQSIISRIRVGPMVPQTVREMDWKSVIEHLINFGKNLGPGSTAVLERLVVLRTASHNFFTTIKSGIEDLNARAENLHNDPTAETSGELSQGNSSSELQLTGPTEGLKRRAVFPQTSEDVADGVLGATERSEP